MQLHQLGVFVPITGLVVGIAGNHPPSRLELHPEGQPCFVDSVEVFSMARVDEAPVTSLAAVSDRGTGLCL
jgi:hypothetical protein